MFADVYFHFETDQEVLAVPENALTRSADGDWQLFVVDDDGGFAAQEVTLGRSFGDYREVLGIKAGLKLSPKVLFLLHHS